jgi:conserved hypothetical phage tail region protein
MPYPLPVFHFKVEMAGLSAEFTEVTGLNIEVQVIEYRHGLSPTYSMTKMPGLQKYGNITLKRGVFKGNNEFFELYQKIKMNTVERQDVLISLLDETHAPVMQWQVQEAWVTKITSPDLKSSGNEVAVETIEIAHEGLAVIND